MSILSAQEISKTFKHRKVVKNLSLEIKSGEVVGLLGPNGAGKTTAFYMIVGLISADSGTILLDGQDLTAQPMHRRAKLGLGYLPQEALAATAKQLEVPVSRVYSVATFFKAFSLTKRGRHLINVCMGTANAPTMSQPHFRSLLVLRPADAGLRRVEKAPSIARNRSGTQLRVQRFGRCPG